MQRDEGLHRLAALGFPARRRARCCGSTSTTRSSAASPATATPASRGSRRSKPSTRQARAELGVAEDGLQRWDGDGAVGYLVLDARRRAQLARPPEDARLVVCERTFPTGMLGHYVRRLADGGLVAVLTATSPARLGPPGGPKVAGTNPLALGIPSSDGEPVVVDVSMGAVTWGDVIAGLAAEEQLVPFGGEQWHKAFALALGMQLWSTRSSAAGPRRARARRAAVGRPVSRCFAETGIRLPGG